MATHASAAKRHRQSLKRRNRNRQVKSAYRTAFKNAREALVAGEKTTKDLAKTAESTIARAAAKGVIKKKTAARLVSRLAKKVAKAK